MKRTTYVNRYDVAEPTLVCSIFVRKIYFEILVFGIMKRFTKKIKSISFYSPTERKESRLVSKKSYHLFDSNFHAVISCGRLLLLLR